MIELTAGSPAFMDPREDRTAGVRRGVYLLVVTVALAGLWGRIAQVRAVDGRTPFLSANDRSRWCAAEALLRTGRFEIDDVMRRPGWNTIDKVSHRGRDGRQHFYSSKPPWLSVLLAGVTWLVERFSGTTLQANVFYVGRWVIAAVNTACWATLLVLICLTAERWGKTDLGRFLVVTTGAWGTLLSPFGVSINNHLPAAAAAMVAFYALMRIWYDGARRPGMFLAAGAGASLAAASDLPALAFLALTLAALGWRFPRPTLQFALPPVLLTAALFFGTNLWAHDSLRPPYAHRTLGEDWRGDNWYDYAGSYWTSGHKSPLDRGEPSRGRYAFHLLVGHHGIFALTPIWLLVPWGLWLWSRTEDRAVAAMAVAAVTAICLGFYILGRPLEDRNYGGANCGFRWALWLIPLWLWALLPAGDRLMARPWGRWLALALLAASVFSATFAALNPWTHPWIYHYGQLFR